MREVQTQHWADFCSRLNQFARSARLAIQQILPNGQEKDIARDATLEQVDYTKESCNDVIRIRCSSLPDHTVTEPIHIKLKETEGGAAFNAVLIEAESGSTFLTFHPVLRREWLDGLKLA